MDKMNEKETCCLGKILQVIDVLQKNAERMDACNDGCTKPFLGNTTNVICFNTRPVTFYTCNGEIIEASYQSGTETLTSSVFRVEKVDDCCVTCSILAANPDTSNINSPYISTNQTIIFNLDCICAIQCLNDVIVENL